MPTPLQALRRDDGVNAQEPGSGRRTRVVHTPQSALTPNDDAAERASARRKRRSDAVKASLCDAFSGGADQAGADAALTLPTEALSAMFEQCIRLAAENKISERNVWQLDLIRHLPSIVGAAAAGGGRGAAAGGDATSDGFSFQKISGGLDAGVAIYSRRVDHTYKEAFQSLQGMDTRHGGDDGEASDGGDGDEGDAAGGDDAVEDAAAAAAREARAASGGNNGSKRSRGAVATAGEEATLAAPESLRAKKADAGHGSDPLFHCMSALFDEGGARGLLLLNRSVYCGCRILTEPHDVPEAAVPLLNVAAAAAAQQDSLLDLAPLAGALRGAVDGAARELTPSLSQLRAALRAALPGGGYGTSGTEQDVAAIMAAVTRDLRPTPVPLLRASATAQAAAGEQGTAARMQEGDRDSDQNGAAAAGGSLVVASFLAETQADVASCDAPADDMWEGGDGAALSEDGDYAGGDDSDVGGGGRSMPRSREDKGMMPASSDAPGLLGLGGGEPGQGELLDADALQQLLGGGNGAQRSGAATAGTGWAGGTHWRYRGAAAAIARMAGAAAGGSSSGGGGSGTLPAKRSAARQRGGDALRLDFGCLAELPSDALARGTRKETCLASAPAGDTLLPVDLHFSAARLARLFLRQGGAGLLRCGGSSGGSGLAGGSAQQAAGEEAQEADDWDDSGTGGDWWGDDATATDAAHDDERLPTQPGAPGQDEWDRERELLRAPQRSICQGGGVTYARAAKQVDVRALKGLLWDSLIAAADPAGAAEPASCVPFQRVIDTVPANSAAGARADVSVHMCFICLLHLANEQGLAVRGSETLDTLSVSGVPV